MSALVAVPITCTYTDPDGTASSVGTVTIVAPARLKVSASNSVISGTKSYNLTSGALPGGAQVMAPPSGSVTYRVTENIEGNVVSYNLTVAAANSSGVDLSTISVGD